MATNEIHAITEEDFDAEVLGSSVPVLVDFVTPWCAPCRALAPIVQRLAAEAGGRFRVATVSADECPALAARLAVKAFPTVIVFAGGKERSRHVGTTHREKLLAMVASSS
jgi:thioredoxin 1